MSQVSEAVNAQLEVGVSRRERRRRLLKVAEKIAYWQRTAAKAARCHRAKRLKLLREMGIPVSTLEKCFRC